MKISWKNILTNKDTFPDNKFIFSLKTIFIFTICSTLIFYRFVYIYLYDTKLSNILYNYEISKTSKLYREALFIIAWTIFIITTLFRLSEFIYDKIIIPITKLIIYLIAKIIIKIQYKLSYSKKTIARKSNYDTIRINKHKKK